jgi:hypothetical protein
MTRPNPRSAFSSDTTPRIPFPQSRTQGCGTASLEGTRLLVILLLLLLISLGNGLGDPCLPVLAPANVRGD